MTRDISKLFYYGFFRALGVYHYFRFSHRHIPIVLTYHGVLPKIPEDHSDYEYRNFVTVRQFENQIKLLLKKFKPVKVSDFYNGNPNLNRGFLITFDDGFRNNYSHALPVLKKYGLQATFFITTDFVGSRELLWTEQVTRLIQKTNEKEFEVELDKNYSLRLNSALKRERASELIRRYLKHQSPSKRNKILEQMKLQLRDVELSVNEENEERYLFMTWEDIKKMANSGQVIGSHTHTHPILSTLDEKESFQELKLSKENIENHTNEPCLTMSYPNGEKDDYFAIQKRQLSTLGYKCAFTQISPFKNYQTDQYELNRLNISLKMKNAVFEAKISGFR
jgi:peptidoglycan/xylan/chitin deacetylase (PgdA/CDA1 family)